MSSVKMVEVANGSVRVLVNDREVGYLNVESYEVPCMVLLPSNEVREIDLSDLKLIANHLHRMSQKKRGNQ